MANAAQIGNSTQLYRNIPNSGSIAAIAKTEGAWPTRARFVYTAAYTRARLGTGLSAKALALYGAAPWQHSIPSYHQPGGGAPAGVGRV